MFIQATWEGRMKTIAANISENLKPNDSVEILIIARVHNDEDNKPSSEQLEQLVLDSVGQWISPFITTRDNEFKLVWTENKVDSSLLSFGITLEITMSDLERIFKEADNLSRLYISDNGKSNEVIHIQDRDIFIYTETGNEVAEKTSEDFLSNVQKLSDQDDFLQGKTVLLGVDNSSLKAATCAIDGRLREGADYLLDNIEGFKILAVS